RERRLVECNPDDPLARHVRNLVPDARPGNAKFHQGAAHRQMGVLDELDDLQLFASRIPHAASAPSAVMLFLSRRFSRVSSATTSFRADASRRRSLTSSEVAARAV